MGMHSILSVFGEELSEDVVRSNWPDRYADALQTIYDEENPGDGIYAYVESTYDREHDVFLPDVLRAIPGATLVVLTQMNNTTDSGSAWGYRKDGPAVEFLGTVRGKEARFGRDVVEHYETEYGVRIWTLWEAFDYRFARKTDE
ncbi:hypothetical protein [Natronorubrum sp. FCH18a]|uniref:hypothetical protein n=1 Tax=Natronorubrum sp. FCH18a TaxID=3447018 RepID=UPI003F51520F